MPQQLFPASPALLSSLPSIPCCPVSTPGSALGSAPRSRERSGPVSGAAQGAAGPPGRSNHSQQTPLAHPGPRSGRPDTTGAHHAGLARQHSGTGGMEPTRTMAELISTSADGKGHGPHKGEGVRRGPRRGETGPRSELLPGYRPVTVPRRARLFGVVCRGSRARASGKAQRHLPITGARPLWELGTAQSSPNRDSGRTPQHPLGPSTAELRGAGS